MARDRRGDQLTRATIDRRRFLAGALASLPAAGALLAACSGDGRAPRVAVTDPDAMVRTRWGDDPFARGAYSYVPLGAGDGAAVRRALGAPVDERLFFAGEATSVDAPATVHGAIASGRRAAGELLATSARRDESIVVLGAGAAGLAAAAELRDAGFAPLVVEARARTGGRVHTDTSLGVPVDLGAAWVHDAREGNPVLALARRASVTLRAVEGTSVLRAPGRRRLDVARVEARLDEAMARVGAGAAADGELDAALRAEAARAGLREPELTWAITSLVEHQLGAAATDVSWRSFDEGNDEDADALPEGGYAAVLAPLAERVDVRTGTVVTAVRWSRARNALRTADGAEIGFDRCIVTLPLGVLQSGTPAFEPALPAATMHAIRTLGSGLLDKVALRFPDVFWERDVDWLGFTGLAPGEWATWADLLPGTGAPILVGLHAATVARTLATRTDEQVRAGALAALRSMYA